MAVHRRASPGAFAAPSAWLLGALLVAGAFKVQAARPWYWHAEQAQRALAGGDAPAAEQQVLDALAVRARSACHVRTYGVLHADYLPYFLLGVARVRQGKLAEAREAFEREDAEGVIQDCPSTRLQALDLQSFLAELPGRTQGTTAAQEDAAPQPAPANGRVAAELRGSAEDAVSRARLAVDAAEEGTSTEASLALATAEALLAGSPSLAAAAAAGSEARRAMDLVPPPPLTRIAPHRVAGAAAWVELTWSAALPRAPAPVLVPVQDAR